MLNRLALRFALEREPSKDLGSMICVEKDQIHAQQDSLKSLSLVASFFRTILSHSEAQKLCEIVCL